MTFSNSGNAKRHLRMHRETLPSFSCSVCGKSFNRKDNLVKHKERLHKLFRTNIDAIREDSRSSWQCKMCGDQFGADKESFEDHIVYQVCKKKDDCIELNMNGRMECDLCDKSYADKSSLKRHMNSNHGSKKQEIICKKCKKKFSAKSSLVRHMNTFHKD